MDGLKFLAGLVGWLSLTAVLLFTAIALPTFHLGFYAAEYDKYGIHQGIGMEKDDLMDVTQHLLDYMKGKKDDLEVETQVHGQQRAFFNQREKDHMVDVKDLFQIGFLVRRMGVLFFLLAVLSLVLCKVKPTLVMAKAIVIGNASFLVVFGILAALIARNFDRAFTLFHEVFFRNDLWILNPETDLLLNIVPLPFFMDIAALVGLLFSGAMAVITVGCLAYLFRHRRRA